MKARIQKWGNSLALRIPKPFAAEVGLEEDTPVDLLLEDGRIVIEPVPEPTLEELLSQVNETNLHGEVESGPPRGKEEW